MPRQDTQGHADACNVQANLTPEATGGAAPGVAGRQRIRSDGATAPTRTTAPAITQQRGPSAAAIVDLASPAEALASPSPPLANACGAAGSVAASVAAIAAAPAADQARSPSQAHPAPAPAGSAGPTSGEEAALRARLAQVEAKNKEILAKVEQLEETNFALEASIQVRRRGCVEFFAARPVSVRIEGVVGCKVGEF